MAVWELAVIIFALTYSFVNVIYMMIMIKFMSKCKGLVDKCIKVSEKMIDEADEDY